MRSRMFAVGLALAVPACAHAQSPDARHDHAARIVQSLALPQVLRDAGQAGLKENQQQAQSAGAELKKLGVSDDLLQGASAWMDSAGREVVDIVSSPAATALLTQVLAMMLTDAELTQVEHSLNSHSGRQMLAGVHTALKSPAPPAPRSTQSTQSKTATITPEAAASVNERIRRAMAQAEKTLREAAAHAH